MRSLVVVIVLTAHAALACPPGRPCAKLQRQVQTVHDKADFYTREIASAMPRFDRKVIARFLVISRWLPVYGDGETIDLAATMAMKTMPAGTRIWHVRDNDKLRFVDPTGEVSKPKPGERNVLVRQIERDKAGNIYIDVDGEAYRLWKCVDKKATVCLQGTGQSMSQVLQPKE